MVTLLPKPEKRWRKPKRLVIRRVRPRRERKSSIGALKRQLWRLFAAYIKARDGNTCVTCGRGRLEGKNWQAGHFIRKDGHAAVEFDPKNVHSQCGRCNLYERGAVHEHAEYIVREYGREELARLVDRSRHTHNWTAPELRDLIAALEKGWAEYELLYYERYL